MTNYRQRTQYDREIKQFPRLSKKEEFELGTKSVQGNELAIDTLVECNLRLVQKIANFFVDRGLDYEDLVQEGNMGLMHAAKTFNPNKGRFSGYAGDWIKHKIRRAINNYGTTIRFPVTAQETINSIQKTSDELKNKLERNPEPIEISKALNKNEKLIRKYLYFERLREIVSLDAYLSPDCESDLAFVLEKDLAIKTSLERKMIDELVNEAVEELDPKLKEIVKRRNGFNGYEVHIFEDIGIAMGTRGEYPRLLNIKAQRKLKIKISNKGYTKEDFRIFNN